MINKRLVDDLGTNTMGLTWIDRIDSADSTSEVLEIARVYVASLTPEEIVQIPVKCRPHKLVDGNDLAEYALDLMRETCRDPEPSPLMLKLSAIMSHASTRATELMAVPNEPQGQSRVD